MKTTYSPSCLGLANLELLLAVAPTGVRHAEVVDEAPSEGTGTLLVRPH